MHVVVAETVDERTTQSLWSMYDQAFQPFLTLTPSRETLSRGEFGEMMRDQRVLKYLAEERDGEIVGLSVVTRHLDTVPWVNPEYFATRWPTEYSQGRVFYSAFSCVRPDRQGQRVLAQLQEPYLRAVARAKGVLGWELSGPARVGLNLSEGLARRVGPGVVPELHVLDEQVYYAVTFRDAAPVGGTLEGQVIKREAEDADSGRPKR